MFDGFIELMMLKESIASIGIANGWSKEKCQIEFIKELAAKSNIELSDRQAKELIND
jgi:hypothetical protein